MKGEFKTSLLDQSNYKAQIEDIIRISIDKIYQSKEVIDKEIAGYNVLSTLLHAYSEAFERYYKNDLRHYDRLLLNDFGIPQKADMYELLIQCCGFISQLTDGNAVQTFQKVKGNL